MIQCATPEANTFDLEAILTKQSVHKTKGHGKQQVIKQTKLDAWLVMKHQPSDNFF